MVDLRRAYSERAARSNHERWQRWARIALDWEWGPNWDCIAGYEEVL